MTPITNLLGEKEKLNWHAMEAKYTQKPFAKALRQMIDTGWIYRQNPDLEFIEFTSTGNTWAGNAIKGKIQKEMGYRKGWYDLTFFIKFKEHDAFPAVIECKYDTDYSDSQKELGEKFDKAKIRRAKMHNPHEGYEILRGWGVQC